MDDPIGTDIKVKGTIRVESEQDIVRLRVIEDGETKSTHSFPVEYALFLAFTMMKAAVVAATYRDEHPKEW